MFIKRDWNTFDYTLIILLIILVTIGIIAIGSAIHINLDEDATERNKQILFFVLGLFFLFAITVIDYNFIGKFYIVIYVLNIILLIAVLLFGKSVKGGVRWIKIGIFNFQPSEFAKIMMILFISKILDKNKDKINNIFVLVFIIGITLFPVLLIQMQPSLSSSLVIVAILLIELFIAKINYKYVFTAGTLGIGGICFLLWDVQRQTPILIDKILKPYHINRILSHLHPENDPSTYYQTMQSIRAIGSGQLKGKGLYNGTLNQLSYLPESHNDFIFAVIGEEFGFIGCSVVLGLLFLIVMKCIIVAAKADDFYGKLIASGIAGMFAVQTFLHIGVVTGILPNTGQSLPFVSYGGSSLWANMIALGLILNIGTKRVKTLF